MCKYDTSSQRVSIGFTKAGKHSFHQLSPHWKRTGSFIGRIRHDLAEYIERHIDADDPLISEFDVRYEDGLMLQGLSRSKDGKRILNGITSIYPLRFLSSSSGSLRFPSNTN